ncbi:hypothetical protein L1987_20693 [Smallanthus sonchifolius]|uniref:Uncharacterized protein n=1 Tax=Smallanthus sonchifolius TaxID=185202 RepID=A0ACB9IUC5_9ASTR|nr:hypothetical protein L1987_20693 [Smallanthus sonchifolius]
MNQKVADDYLAMFSSFMASYVNFIGGKFHDPEVIEEDFKQIDPVDLEEMNIQWNMAMLMRQAKDFLKKTSRKYIGSNSRSHMGFDKTKNDENYDWGIHLEDLEGAVSQAFVAEIHSEKPEESTDDDSYSDGSCDGESVPSVDEEIEQVQNINSDIASGVAEDDIVLTQNASDGADSESIPIAKVLMADMFDPSKVKDSVFNQKLKDNDKLCIDRIDSLKRDLNSLGLKYKEQAYHLDMAYAEIEKRNEVVAQKNKEISDKESEVIKLHRKLEKFENSSVVLDYFNENADSKKRVAGIGFIPPPFNANYVVEPEIIHEEEIDPKTVLKVNPVTGEDMVYESDSEDEVFDDKKVEGIPKEVKLDEPTIVKTVTRVRCILTEPGEVKVITPKMLDVASHQKMLSSKVPTQVYVPKKPVKCSGKLKTAPSQSKVVQILKRIDEGKSTSNKFEIPHVGISKDSEPEVKLSRPQRRRRNRKLKKLLETSESDNNISNNVFPIKHNVSSLKKSKCETSVPKNDKVKFEKVNYVEQLEHNILSVSQVCDKKFSFHFNDAECYILKPGFVIPDEWILMKAPSRNDTYVLDMSVAATTDSIPTCLLSKASESYSILWHRKLAHINYRKMNYIVKNDLVLGIPKMKFSFPDDCIPCKKGKQRKKSHKSKSKNSIVTPLELLQMDLFGPISIRSIGGKSYCLVVTDDFSRFSWVKFLSSKAETTELVQYLILGLENFAPYVPQQNGVAERKNRTLVETARTMLADSKLPVTFWAEAVNTTCHVLNRVLTVKRYNKTCYELLNNRKPNLEYLLPFGTPCTLLKFRDVPTKFIAKAIEGIFLGGFIPNAVQNSSVPSTSAPDPNVASCSGPQDSESDEDNAIFQNSSTDPLLGDDPLPSTQAQGEIPTNLDSEIPINQVFSYQSDTTQVDVLPVPEVASIKELKDYPVTNIIGNLHDGVKTRSIVDNTWN